MTTIIYSACAECNRKLDGEYCIRCEATGEGMPIGKYPVTGRRGETVQKKDILDIIDEKAHRLRQKRDAARAAYISRPADLTTDEKWDLAANNISWIRATHEMEMLYSEIRGAK